MNTSIDIKKFFELIDLYKYASVKGERVEIIVTPYEENGKWDDSKRVITIGLQDGISRDRDSFIIDNVEDFDRIILPQILAYYSVDDALGNWDVTVPEVEGTTAKGVAETVSGNLVYLESLDSTIYDRLTADKKNVEEKTTYNKSPLTDEEKIWDEVILYAKRRRVTDDFYNGWTLTEEDKKSINDFILKVIETEKSVSISNDRKNREKNEKIFEELLIDKEKLESLGLNEELINKLAGYENAAKRLGAIAGNEKRVRRRLDLDNPEIQAKIKFATEELDRVDYFNLRNASVTQFENGMFSSSQPKAVTELKEIYANDKNLSAEQKEMYQRFSDEILGYLEKKAKKNRKVVKTEVETPNVVFRQLDDVIVNSYDELKDAINLVRFGKLDTENYEIIVERDLKETNKRSVRISLTNGNTRGDRFNFLFTDGIKFDQEFTKILKEIRKTDPNFLTTINTVNLPEYGDIVTILHESQGGNEVLIKNALNGLSASLTAEVIKDDKEPPNYHPTDVSLILQEKERKKEPPKDDMITKLMRLQQEINEEAARVDELFRKEIKETRLDTTVDFELLHEYVKKYKITNTTGELKIIDRKTNEEYNPKSNAEKRNIEFAIYWSVMAGLDESKDDVVVGEKYAFNAENKKLFNIMNVQIQESIKKGIEVDFESLREQFRSSGVNRASEIYDRLFKNQFYNEYVLKYYNRALGYEGFDLEDKEYIENIRAPKENTINKFELDEDTKRDAEIQAAEIAESQRREMLVAKTYQLTKKLLEDRKKKEYEESAREEATRIVKENEHNELIEGAKDQAEMLQRAQELDDIRNSAKEEAKEIIKRNERAELVEGAKDQAEKLQRAQELDNIRSSAKEEAKRLQKENEHIELIEGAKEEARRIEEKAEKEEILSAAKDQARMIQDQNEHEEIIESAREEAERLAKEAMYRELFDAAEEEARRIQRENEHAELAEGAKDQARMIQDQNEHEEIVESAKEEAKRLQKEDEHVKLLMGAEEQAKLLSGKDYLFEIVQNKEEEEKKSPDIEEMCDAFEVVESYASAEQPTSVKIFFDRDNPGNAEVIVSNGINGDETVMYQRTFSEERLIDEVIPVICQLYAKNNDVTYNEAFDVPNTSKGGLVVVGTDEKTFQISNAPKKIVKICKTTLDEELKKEREKETKKSM